MGIIPEVSNSVIEAMHKKWILQERYHVEFTDGSQSDTLILSLFEVWTLHRSYPLVICYKKLWKITPFSRETPLFLW